MVSALIKPTVKDTRAVYLGRKLKVIEEDLSFASGHRSVHVTVRHPGAVVILPCSNDGRFFMIRQYRHSVGRELLEFPAGTLELGEEPLACSQREIVEEVGQRALQWHALGTLLPAPGFCDEVQHLFLARELSPASAPADADELIEPVQLSALEIEEHMRTGQILDAKSIAIYFRARLQGYL